MRNKSKIQENQFRALVRMEIAKIVREQEESPEEAPKKEEPKQDPEIGRKETLTKISNAYVKSLRNNLQEINVEEISDAFMSVMDSMGYSREAKVNVLRTIKNKLQA